MIQDTESKNGINFLINWPLIDQICKFNNFLQLELDLDPLGVRHAESKNDLIGFSFNFNFE